MIYHRMFGSLLTATALTASLWLTNGQAADAPRTAPDRRAGAERRDARDPDRRPSARARRTPTGARAP